MDVRIIDIRISKAGRDALTFLQRHTAHGKPGDVMRYLMSNRVDPGAHLSRHRPTDRFRATVDVAMATELRASSRALGATIEEYVEALLRAKATGLGWGQCKTTETTTTETTTTRTNVTKTSSIPIPCRFG